MAGSTQPQTASPEDIARARNSWQRFTKAATWGTAATVIIVALLGLFLL
jgi:hypothetical protein